MKQVSQHYRTGELTLIDVPAPICRDGGVVIATSASLISAGTEKVLMDLAKASLVGKAVARPDLVRKVVTKARQEGIKNTLRKVQAKLDTPIPLGYSCAGEVVEVGRHGGTFSVGDRVACGGAGYANHAEVNFVPKHLCVPLPPGVADEDAAFVTVGSIALQGVRQAEVTLGERVVVIGLGLIGLMTVQILVGAGCRVLGYDLDPNRAALAQALGAELGTTDSDALTARTLDLSEGHGADAVIVAASTKGDGPIQFAASLARLKGRVVVVGFVGMNLPRDIFYRKELELRLSMSYGPGRYDPSYEEGGHDYPYAHVRWTEQRNMAAFVELIARGVVTPQQLITHRVAFEQATEAYALLQSKQPSLGIVLTYNNRPSVHDLERARTVEVPQAKPVTGELGVGVIGAGNFARGVLLPVLEKQPGVRLTGVVTATGMSAEGTAKRFGFAYASTRVDKVLHEDAGTQAVVIATRHDRHAELAIAALRAGKQVFVEKPLALTLTSLREVEKIAYAHSNRLMVGYNRRFSPLVTRLRDEVAGRGALLMHYRVNAGHIPADSWVHRAEGGGRIVGEGCHFIDTLSAVCGELPVSVMALAAGGQQDCVSIQMMFEGGSVATLTYSALGDPSLPKERLEVFGTGVAATLDDFREVCVHKKNRRQRVRVRNQDKGFAGEFEAFVEAVRSGGPMPISLASLVRTTEATFAVHQSLQSGHVVRLPLICNDDTSRESMSPEVAESSP